MEKIFKDSNFVESLQLLPHEHVVFANIFGMVVPSWVDYFGELPGHFMEEEEHDIEFEWLGEGIFTYNDEFEKWLKSVKPDCEEELDRLHYFVSDLNETEIEIDYLSNDEGKQLKYILDNNNRLKDISLASVYWYNSGVSYYAKYIPWYRKWILYETGDIGDEFYFDVTSNEGELKDAAKSFIESVLTSKYIEYQSKGSFSSDLVKREDLNLPY